MKKENMPTRKELELQIALRTPLDLNKEVDVSLSDEMKRDLKLLFRDPDTTKEQVLDFISKHPIEFYVKLMPNGLSVFQGVDRDRFIELFNCFTKNDELRNISWQRHHVQITQAISCIVDEKVRFPTRGEIAEKTGLSRTCIDQHLKEYYKSELFDQKQQEIQLMREKLLAALFSLSLDGDVKAAKVFLQATSPNNEVQSIKNQQNNFIQINGIVITEEQLKELPEEKQIQINEIINLFKSSRKNLQYANEKQ